MQRPARDGKVDPLPPEKPREGKASRRPGVRASIEQGAAGSPTAAASKDGPSSPQVDLKETQKLIAQASEQNPLHDMASLGRVHDVESLIQAGADREKSDAFGRTATHMAACMGHEAVVRMLARLGAKLEQYDSMGHAPMHIAAHNGHKSVIAALLDLRANVDSVGAGGRTPFHMAVDGLQADACRLLVPMRADPEARDERHDTPLTLAVRMGHTLVLDSLVDSKCDVHTRDDEGATPLHLAACKQRLECIEVLVERSARLETSDKYGLTPLHVAARTGEPEAAEKLVAMKANVMGKTTLGRQTPLHLAAGADELETIDVLFKAKASLDMQDNRGYTALHTSVEYDRSKACAKLLQFGASRDLPTRNSDTALHLACLRDQASLVQLLMRQGCNVNARGRNGYAALHVACEIGSIPCASALLDSANRSELVLRDSQAKAAPTNPNAQDQHKQTPLHIAAWHGLTELVELLISNAAEIDVIDSEESTPLSLAVAKDHDLTVRCLLRLNADPVRRNAQELAPLQLACVNGALSVAKTLAGMKLLPSSDEPAWRRPMALANFYGHKDVAAFFFQPVPKNRLMLSMVRAVSTTAISVTMTPIIAEPMVTKATINVVARPEGFMKSRSGAGRQQTDPFSGGTMLACVRNLKEKEWMEGKSIQLTGLAANTGYLIRLTAVNDAGTTHGEVVEAHTKAPKDGKEKESPRRSSGSKDKGLSGDEGGAGAQAAGPSGDEGSAEQAAQVA